VHYRGTVDTVSLGAPVFAGNEDGQIDHGVLRCFNWLTGRWIEFVRIVLIDAIPSNFLSKAQTELRGRQLPIKAL